MVRKIALWLLCMVALAAVLWLLFGGSMANAAPPMTCAQHERVTEDLDRRYDEQPIAMGLHANGMVMEVFASQQNRTWTIVLTQPNGLSCLIGSGHSLERMPWMAKEWRS